MHLKKWFVLASLCSALFAGHAFADEAAADNFDDVDELDWVNYVPTTSYWGVRGLTQNMSAQSLGAGRFNAALSTAYFNQGQTILTPAKGANVLTMRGVLSYGLNDKVDLFGIVPMYTVMNDTLGSRTVISGIAGGIKFLIPVIPDEIPFVRIAGSAYFINGLRVNLGGDWNNADVTTNYDYWREGRPGDEIDTSNWKNNLKEQGGWHAKNLSYAGYDYFDARKNDHLDVVFNIVSTFFMGQHVQLHVNYGNVITPYHVSGSGIMCLLSAGLQIDAIEWLTIGLEANWRTVYNSLSFSDPFWITPSVMLRSPYYGNGWSGMGLVLGTNLRASSKPDNKETYSLEKYRLFGDVVFSLDFFAAKRAELERERRRNEAEKARLRKQAELSAAQKDSIAMKAHEDSLRLAAEMAERAHADSVRAQFVADSLAAEMGDLAEKAKQDSIAQAAAQAELIAESEKKRIADSLALAEAQRRLEEERAKRSEAENMLLSTGMLILDAVYFQTGKADIHLNSRPYLTTIAKMLAKYPKLRIEIGGHTDNTGSFETNTSLSQRRADAVFMFMHSVEPSLAQTLSAKGYGPTMPKAENNTAAGREVNRRVELKVLNPEVLKEYNP